MNFCFCVFVEIFFTFFQKIWLMSNIQIYINGVDITVSPVVSSFTAWIRTDGLRRSGHC
jgi:hypothetical protein